jgi:dTDP-4-amino-4,6-dideoxygalactose transaminase
VGDRGALLARLNAAIDLRWFTNNGPYVQEFEARVAEYLEVGHCVAVSNATIGLQIAIRALDLRGEVVVPAFTFPATVHALAWEGIRPVFCDIDPATHNLNPSEIEGLISPDTTGILGVHLWGNPCAVEELEAIAELHGLHLLYDAAHAFGCSHQGRMIGNFGRAEVFSFHATKFLGCGEGGAITTNDDELAARFRRLRNFGIEDEEVIGIGTNGKMSEFAAAMGLTSLESCDDFIARNQRNLRAYADALAAAPGLSLFGAPSIERRNDQYVVVEVDQREAGRSRDQLLAALHRENVLAKRYFCPGCHRLEPYRSLSPRPLELPQTDRLCQRLIQLPTGTAVSESDIARIGDLLQTLTTRARRAA